MQPVLYYIHDPMCSWCWAFEKARHALFSRLPDTVRIRRLLGGLAVDSNTPMPPEMVDYVQANWRAIEARFPDLHFNFAFWTRCQPRRATWPACRAVIAAREQGGVWDQMMTRAIQQAYYRQARNPSEDSTLIELADELGLDSQRFAASLNASATRTKLQDEIQRMRDLHVNSFPSLVLQTESGAYPIAVDYQSAPAMEEGILRYLQREAQHE